MEKVIKGILSKLMFSILKKYMNFIMIYHFQIKHLIKQSKMKIFQTINQLKYYTNQFLEHSKKVHTPFTDNIWGAYFANMQIIRKFDQGICFLL